jgi:hypothetical protein
MLNDNIIRILVKKQNINVHILFSMIFLLSTLYGLYLFNFRHVILVYTLFYLVLNLQWYTSVLNIKRLLEKSNLNSEEENIMKIEKKSIIFYYVGFIWLPIIFVIVSMFP